MVMTKKEIEEQLDLIESEKELYTKEELEILFSILNDTLDENSKLTDAQVDNLLGILRFLKINNGIISPAFNLTFGEMEKIYAYLNGLKNNNVPNLANVSNFDARVKEIKESIFAEDEKNKLIASYGRDDIYFYAVKLNYLNAITIITSDSVEDNYDKVFFPHSFFHKSINSLGHGLGKELEELGDSYTLIKYIGDNKFEEFYTGRIINLYRDSVENPQSFILKQSGYIENPLCIIGKIENLEIATPSIENKIISNAKNRDRIVELIDTAAIVARKDLKEDLRRIADSDYIYAKEEDNIYEFKKKM